MKKECGACGGTGMCQECDGEGTVWSGLLGDLRIAKERCPECSGSGKCNICSGTGEVDEEE